MKRRTFVGLAVGGTAAARAQPATRVHRIGLLAIGAHPSARPAQWEGFRASLRSLGYVEGHNLEILHAFASGDADRMPTLAAELVRAGVDVIVAIGTRETQAARRATSTIPIVMVVVPDPVGQGLVASLARPGSNVTGLAGMVPGLSQKYVELIRETLPAAKRIAVIANPPNPVAEHRAELEAAARRAGLELRYLPVREPDDFDPALAQAKRDRIAAIIATVDPVGAGLAASLARPGGNVTGNTFIEPDLGAKRLQVLKELLPGATRIGELMNPANPAMQMLRAGESDALRLLGMEALFADVVDADGLEAAFADLVRRRAQALVVHSDSLFVSKRARIMELALKHALPTMGEGRQFVEAGALISYAPSSAAMIRNAATFIDRIFKGAKPGDLPIERPTRFELVVNAKTARALRVNVPQALLLRADEVIE